MNKLACMVLTKMVERREMKKQANIGGAMRRYLQLLSGSRSRQFSRDWKDYIWNNAPGLTNGKERKFGDFYKLLRSNPESMSVQVQKEPAMQLLDRYAGEAGKSLLARGATGAGLYGGYRALSGDRDSSNLRKSAGANIDDLMGDVTPGVDYPAPVEENWRGAGGAVAGSEIGRRVGGFMKRHPGGKGKMGKILDALLPLIMASTGGIAGFGMGRASGAEADKRRFKKRRSEKLNEFLDSNK
jgi:hypothetical protein